LKNKFIAANLPIVGFNNPYKPEPAKSSLVLKQNSPWSSGSFYLVTAIVGFLAIGAMIYFLPWYASPLAIIGVILIISVIGALQLRNDDRLSEKNFLELMVETFKRLPLLKNFSKKNRE
jgi:hypothetical protein